MLTLAAWAPPSHQLIIIDPRYAIKSDANVTTWQCGNVAVWQCGSVAMRVSFFSLFLDLFLWMGRNEGGKRRNKNKAALKISEVIRSGHCLGSRVRNSWNWRWRPWRSWRPPAAIYRNKVNAPPPGLSAARFFHSNGNRIFYRFNLNWIKRVDWTIAAGQWTRRSDTQPSEINRWRYMYINRRQSKQYSLLAECGIGRIRPDALSEEACRQNTWKTQRHMRRCAPSAPT